MNIFIWFIKAYRKRLIHLTRQTAGYKFCTQIKTGYMFHKQQKYTTLQKNVNGMCLTGDSKPSTQKKKKIPKDERIRHQTNVKDDRDTAKSC
jgi:hypothetical protein